MTEKKWAEDSFWESYDRNRITTILTIVDEEGRKTAQQLTVSKFNPDGGLNPDYAEIVETLTEEKITENTNLRNEKKANERKMAEERRLEHKKSVELQKLFEAKIQSFEIEEIKNSKNRFLKSKLRKAKNIVEVQIYSMMIVMESMKENESESN